MNDQTVVVKLTGKQAAWLSAWVNERPKLGKTGVSKGNQILRAVHDAMDANPS